MKSLNFTKSACLCVLTGLLIVFVSCNSDADTADEKDTAFVASVVKPVAKKQVAADNTVTMEKLQGFWTDGSTANATYQFKNDSIYDLERSQAFKYALDGKNIKIKYPGKAFIGSISFNKEYLIIQYPDGPGKFWKVKK